MRHKLIVCYLLFIISASFPAVAQRRKPAGRTPAVPFAEQVQAALAVYDFEHAEELLTKEIAALQRKRQPTATLEQQLRSAQQGAIKLRATERIVVIDSLVCDKSEAIRAIRLSAESGRIDTYASTYHTTDVNGATIYENELANKRYLAIPAAGSANESSTDSVASPLRLAFSDKLGDTWSAPTPLTGLNSEGIIQNYPFLLADGITLYYAATGPESFGGYDIFVSRADGEDGSFLSPENIGFPYNSTANDYLLAIDELNELGWFVTDRCQPTGKVCVYTFIPNDTRQLYPDDTDNTVLSARARITSIRDTWTADTKAAQERLAAVRSGKADASKTAPDFVFPINDTRTYTSLSDFRSKEAKDKMQSWIQLQKSTETDATMLERLRDKYATSTPSERKTLAATIQRIEATLYPQFEQLRKLEKDIRNAEMSHK